MSLRILAIETATHLCSVALLLEGQILHQAITSPQQHSQRILPMLEHLLAEAGLSRSQLDVIAFGRGPGNFTGVRLATSVAQACAFALNRPLVPVSTLRSLAQRAWRLHRKPAVLAALDARLQQIYWGYYALGQGEIMQTCEAETVCYPKTAALPPAFDKIYPKQGGFRGGARGSSDRSVLSVREDRGSERREPENQTVSSIMNWVGIGSGWDCYHTLLKAQFESQSLQVQWLAEHDPHAYDIALLAQHDYQQGYYEEATAVAPVYLRDNIAKPQLNSLP